MFLYQQSNESNKLVSSIRRNSSFCILTDDVIRWMFEKYDGVRGFWNPLKKAFYSRKGNKLSLPQDIIDSMPTDLFLDGELWYGMNQFIFSNRLL